MTNRYNLAITLLTHHKWTAGAVYTENLLQSLFSIKDNNLNSTKVLLPETYLLDKSDLRYFKDHILYFNGIRTINRRERWLRKLGLPKHKTLKDQIISHRFDILFPAFHSFNNRSYPLTSDNLPLNPRSTWNV